MLIIVVCHFLLYLCITFGFIIYVALLSDEEKVTKRKKIFRRYCIVSTIVLLVCISVVVGFKLYENIEIAGNKANKYMEEYKEQKGIHTDNKYDYNFAVTDDFNDEYYISFEKEVSRFINFLSGSIEILLLSIIILSIWGTVKIILPMKTGKIILIMLIVLIELIVLYLGFEINRIIIRGLTNKTRIYNVRILYAKRFIFTALRRIYAMSKCISFS